MQVHTFQAESLQAALQKVRVSLGPDACVLHTRQRRQSRLGFFSKVIVEVEATVDVPLGSRFDASDLTLNKKHIKRATAATPANSAASPAAATASASGETSVDTRSTDSPHRSADATGWIELQEAKQEFQPNLQASPEPASNMPQLMLAAGIPPNLAERLWRQASSSSHSGTASDTAELWALIERQVAAHLCCLDSVSQWSAGQRVEVVIGPTGAGKTTTLAKLAASFRRARHCEVGFMTLDTVRLGAVDQLLQYAELVSAPLEVVSSPTQVGPALRRLQDCDVVLLDTAGRAPGDSQHMAELRECLEFAQPDATHLVVSATSSITYVKSALARFSQLRPTDLIISKLDEAVDFGAWLELLSGCDLPLSYLTTGQAVPQDILPAKSDQLARLLLGSQTTAADNFVSR